MTTKKVYFIICRKCDSVIPIDYGSLDVVCYKCKISFDEKAKIFKKLIDNFYDSYRNLWKQLNDDQNCDLDKMYEAFDSITDYLYWK